MTAARLIVALWVFVLAGCVSMQSSGDESFNPAPSSGFSRPRVAADAAFWAMGEPGRAMGPCSDTGSMLPLMDSRSFALLEAYRGQPLHRGDVVRFNRADLSGVLHKVHEVTATHVYVSGLSTDRADGWVSLADVTHRLAGILYAAD